MKIIVVPNYEKKLNHTFINSNIFCVGMEFLYHINHLGGRTSLQFELSEDDHSFIMYYKSHRIDHLKQHWLRLTGQYINYQNYYLLKVNQCFDLISGKPIKHLNDLIFEVLRLNSTKIRNHSGEIRKLLNSDQNSWLIGTMGQMPAMIHCHSGSDLLRSFASNYDTDEDYDADETSSSNETIC
jgi:hypothetical protein